MDINDFYKRVLTSLDVEVSDDYLMIVDNDKLINYRANGIPLVLPTRKNISTMLDEDESGKIITVKQLFNPLDETVIKGDSVSLTKLKKLVEVRLANKMLIIGSLLLSIAENKNHQAKTGMLINQFLVRLNEAKNPGITAVVDSKTIDKWQKLYSNSFGAGMSKFLTTYVKKGGKIGHNKYNRVTTMKYAIYEELCKLEKGGRINDVTLRNKDVKVFKILFEYLVEGIGERGIQTIGSNDKESPGFISLFGLYLSTMGKVQEVLKAISGVDSEWEDTGNVDLVVASSELSGLDQYKRELLKIPREGDVIKTKLNNQSTTVMHPSLNQEPTPKQQVPEEAIDASAAAIKKALYGNLSGVNRPITTQQPGLYQPQQPGMYPQQPMPQQPMPQQPIPQQPMMVPGMYPQQPQQPMLHPGMYPQQPQMPTQQPGVYSGVYQQPVSIGSVGTTSAFGSGAQQAPVQPGASLWNR